MTAPITIKDPATAAFAKWWEGSEAILFRSARPNELAMMAFLAGYGTHQREILTELKAQNAEALTFLNVDKFPGTKGAA